MKQFWSNVSTDPEVSIIYPDYSLKVPVAIAWKKIMFEEKQTNKDTKYKKKNPTQQQKNKPEKQKKKFWKWVQSKKLLQKTKFTTMKIF